MYELNSFYMIISIIFVCLLKYSKSEDLPASPLTRKILLLLHYLKGAIWKFKVSTILLLSLFQNILKYLKV